MTDRRRMYYRRMSNSRFIGQLILIALMLLVLIGAYIRIPAQEPLSPLIKAQEPQSLLPTEKSSGAETVVSEKQEILKYIVEKFGDDADDAIAIVGQCENKSWNPKAVNHNSDGSSDFGIFQLNNRYHGGEENFNWKTNIDKAYKIFKKQGWTPWSCAWVVGEKPFYMKGN